MCWPSFTALQIHVWVPKYCFLLPWFLLKIKSVRILDTVVCWAIFFGCFLLSATPLNCVSLPFQVFLGTELVCGQSLDWHTCFWIAMLFKILFPSNFVSGDTAVLSKILFSNFVSSSITLTGFYLLTWKTWLYFFGDAESGSGPRLLCTDLARLWWVQQLYSLRAFRLKGLTNAFPWIVEILKKQKAAERILQPSSPRMLIRGWHKYSDVKSV